MATAMMGKIDEESQHLLVDDCVLDNSDNVKAVLTSLYGGASTTPSAPVPPMTATAPTTTVRPRKSRQRRKSSLLNESMADMFAGKGGTTVVPSKKTVYDNFEGSLDRDDPNLPLYARLAIRGSSTVDIDEREVIKRATFMLISLCTLGAGTMWCGMYVALGETAAALMPMFYVLVLALALVLTSLTAGQYERFVLIQLGLLLILPMLVHLELGGLQASGGVMLWSFVSPLGAALFRSSNESLMWFKVYLFFATTLIAIEFIPRGPGSTTLPPLFTSFWLMNIVGVMTIIFYAAYFFARSLEAELDRSEALLGSILPDSIARRIKRGENPIMDAHEKVSILFCDVVGFTTAASTMSPEIIIESFLEDFFFRVDKKVRNRRLTKIKTIGDAYMVAGGLEEEGPMDHARQLLGLGSDLYDVLQEVNNRAGTNFRIRIGMHVGPVITGVLGTQQLAYDVWGDAVNVASRMESSGKPQLIHLSERAYKEVKGDPLFQFSCAGQTAIKGKGSMLTYFARPRTQLEFEEEQEQ